jgi:hypothetical protein
MTPFDDVPGEMHRHDHDDLDEQLVDRLLDGRLDPDDAPRDLSVAVELVGTLQGPARPDELADADRVVAMVAAAVHADASPATPATRRKSMLGQSLLAKFAVAAAAALGLAGAGAAAGALPSSAQSTIAGALSHVGVSVPDPGRHEAEATTNDDETADPTSTTTTTTTTAAGTDTTTTPGTGEPGDDRAAAPGAPGTAGLCQAFGSGRGGEQGGKLDATAFRTLENEASTAGKTVDELCAEQRHGSGDGHEDGSTTPTTGTSGEDHGNQHVPDGPPATNPGRDRHDGGDAPSTDSSSHGDDHGGAGQGGPAANRGHGGD